MNSDIMTKAKTKMSKTLIKYFDDLHLAEFGNNKLDINKDIKTYIKLLKRALKWKSHKNLKYLCEYLGAESDERTETTEGCKAIIKEDIDYIQENEL